MIVAVEGIDGAGKNTLSMMLHKRTGAHLVGFPRYDTSAEGSLIRSALYGQMGDLTDSPYAMATLFALDRYHAQGDLVAYAPGGELRSQLVILDRYAASNAAYSVARTGNPAMADWIEKLEFSRLGIVRPDLQILVDTSVDTAHERAKQRARCQSDRAVDTYEKNEALQEATLSAYRALAADGWVSDWITVDGSTPIDKLTSTVDTILSALGMSATAQ